MYWMYIIFIGSGVTVLQTKPGATSLFNFKLNIFF